MKVACDSCMELYDVLEIDMSLCPACGNELKVVEE